MTDKLDFAKQRAEQTLGIEIPEKVAAHVLYYAKRKCEMAGQPESYLPLLFETELTDYYMREAVNARGERIRRTRKSTTHRLTPDGVRSWGLKKPD